MLARSSETVSSGVIFVLRLDAQWVAGAEAARPAPLPIDNTALAADAMAAALSLFPDALIAVRHSEAS
jgi:hypothetical protein